MTTQYSSVTLQALVDALRYDPFYVAITDHLDGHEGLRRDALARYFEHSLKEGNRRGRVVVWPDPALGATVWLFPTEKSVYQAEREAKLAFLETCIGASGRDRYLEIVEFMSPRAAACIDAASWYLSIIGVAPAAQGQGIGARLLEPTLREADDAEVECYLETFDQRNPGFYRRLGFAPIATYAEPVTGATYRIMRRVPFSCKLG